MTEHRNALELDLPEIRDRDPYTRPCSHLVKTGADSWEEAPGRRESKTLLVNRIRQAVDGWRDAGYPGASDTTRRLLQFWFEEDHLLSSGEPFRYYFCQREAMETLIYLYEVEQWRDAADLVQTYFANPDLLELEILTSTRGTRSFRRYVPELGKSAEQELPPAGLTRYAVKMATGTGKTVVVALIIVWSLLHRRLEAGSAMADNLLVVAPNVIVYERLRDAFEAARIFHESPMAPPEWRSLFALHVIVRGDAREPLPAGNLFLTNIQQIYDDTGGDPAPINPVAALLGAAPRAGLTTAIPLLERIRRASNLMALNDEAHHVHDENLVWHKTLMGLHAQIKTRGVPRDNPQILELIGTSAFENFIRELEQEGVGIRTVTAPPKPGIEIFPVEERRQYDIAIPRTTPLYERHYRRLRDLDPLKLPSLASQQDLEREFRNRIDLLHGIIDIKVGSDEVEFNAENVPPIENLLSSLTGRVERHARLTGQFDVLYLKVRGYVWKRCLGGVVELDDAQVRRVLNHTGLLDAIAQLFSRPIGVLTAEAQPVKLAGEPCRLSNTAKFLWRRVAVTARKTLFNRVACYNDFEARFAEFLDQCEDIERFAALAEWFTEFHVQYLSRTGAIRWYYPDFVVIQTTLQGSVNWIVETKGREFEGTDAKAIHMRRWCAVSGPHRVRLRRTAAQCPDRQCSCWRRITPSTVRSC